MYIRGTCIDFLWEGIVHDEKKKERVFARLRKSIGDTLCVRRWLIDASMHLNLFFSRYLAGRERVDWIRLVFCLVIFVFFLFILFPIHSLFFFFVAAVRALLFNGRNSFFLFSRFVDTYSYVFVVAVKNVSSKDFFFYFFFEM